MEIRYNVTGKERKSLVEAIAEITGAKAIYKGVPSCNYEVDYFTIDKAGTLLFDDRADSEEVENMLEELEKKGFHAEQQITTEQAVEEEQIGLNIQMPASYFNSETFLNLTNIIEAKGCLIKKALGIEELPILREEEKISFPWFSIFTLGADEVKAYSHFIYSICEMAKNQKRVSIKEKKIENEKYTFRCFLLRLGFIGDEYKEERKVLLRNLDGSSAFKGGAKHEISK